MNSYPLYKDSGVKWMGKIPSSWSVKRNKYITTPKKDKSEDGSEELLSVSEYLGVVPRNVIRKGEDHLTRSESLEGYLKVSKGDLVNNIMLMWKKGLGVSKYDGIVSPSYSVFSFNKSIPTYHHYLFRTDLYITEFRKNSTGIIQSRLRLYDDDFGIIYSYLPPLPEQTQIVSFLDTKTQKIDELIEKTEQKIKLLKEKRTSLINHCVTKGLNSNVEMKDSGVEWIGEISENFNVVQLKFITNLMRGKFSHRPRNDERFYGGEYPFIQTGDIVSSGKYLTNYKQTLNERGYSVSKEFPLDTLVMTISGNIGDVSILKIRSCFPDSIIGFFPKNQTSETFLYYLFMSMKDEFYKNSTVSTQMNLNVERVGSIRVPLPSIEEQTKIVEYLDEQTQKIDSTIEKETQRIKLLKEYRQSLISEVVTGKVDVRDYNG